MSMRFGRPHEASPPRGIPPQVAQFATELEPEPKAHPRGSPAQPLRALEPGGTRARVLLVDDDLELADGLADALRARGFAVTWKPTADAALAVLDSEPWDVLVTDIKLDGMSGLALCERVVANRPDLPVILVTAFGTMETAIAAIRTGAYDFVTKPFEVDMLELALGRAVRHRALREEVRRLRDVVGSAPGMQGMVGNSPAIRATFDVIDRVAENDVPVLITGASGTGKELVAQALHARGRHSAGPFVVVNCAAIPASLLESELFGHVRGAYTDARITRRGLLLEAQGGTIFLDEIGELPLAMQPKLLRVLQERVVRPVGANHEEPFDARLVTATNRDLEADVEAGRFRADLFYRINVVRIDVPPLSARANDILLLAQRFITRVAAQLHRPVTGLSSAAAAKLMAYRWPGNVRELENCIERAVALASREEILVDDLPEKVRSYQSSEGAPAGTSAAVELISMEEVEQRHISRVLGAVGGSKSAAASILGLDRSTLYRKLARAAQGRDSASVEAPCDALAETTKALH